MKPDLAIVGAGVLGLAHAILARRAGLSVLVVERDHAARGASVRNFGMVWPIGQPRGAQRALAERSAELWEELAREADFRCERPGSLHLAYHDDEWQVLHEYQDAGDDAELWDPDTCLRDAPGTPAEGLRGGLFSAAERSVDPPLALPALWQRAEAMGVRVHSGELCTTAEPGLLRCASGLQVQPRRILICAGRDLRTLYPEVHQRHLQLCKLQMLATAPQPADFELGPMRAAGLTLLHYPAFESCPSLPALRARLDAQLPAHRAQGIHVLVAQHSSGELILGDSHQYGPDFDPFLSTEVEDLILDYLQSFLRPPQLKIARRWHGVYAVQRESSQTYEYPCADSVSAVLGVGGAGMTLSMGLAERHVAGWTA